MPSPFPGMNPYLENPGVWHNFHQSMLPALRDSLVAKIPPGFVVHLEEQVYIHSLEGDQIRLIGRPDVSIASLSPNEHGQAAATIEAPVQIELLDIDRFSESFIEIRDRKSRELVTAIELLSPSNKKPGSDRQQYEGKRNRILASPAHFVEIDLLRAWPRMPMRHAPPCDYCVQVSRAEDRPLAGFWPIALRDSLPTIPVPLSGGHSDVLLDLQAMLHRVYDAAGYEAFIYDEELTSPLNKEDAAWVKAQMMTPQ